jgi:hypothetical protein
MTTISFACHQFPPAIIRHTVWLYLRFTFTYRVEDLFAERSRKAPHRPIPHPRGRSAVHWPPEELGGAVQGLPTAATSISADVFAGGSLVCIGQRDRNAF